ncbi:unnamed protein product [Lepidochelys kempii]
MCECEEPVCCSPHPHLSPLLPQIGACGCFDEFNRFNIEMLSMVAQQILSVLSALAANVTSFTFEGHKIKLVWSCGIFITMNPGGRHGCAHGKVPLAGRVAGSGVAGPSPFRVQMGTIWPLGKNPRPAHPYAGASAQHPGPGVGVKGAGQRWQVARANVLLGVTGQVTLDAQSCPTTSTHVPPHLHGGARLHAHRRDHPLQKRVQQL